ncbi:MAG: CrcB family protein [Proteobacteria bacterium]|nr:CrcB family protein [Pseudomonadota bacterium]
MPTHLLMISLGGALGCALRVLVRDALMRVGAQPWWGTFVINLLGALVMGAVAGSAASIEESAGPWMVVAATGVLTGWTTYSAFSMDVVQLWLRGERGHAVALWAATLVGAPLLAIAGGIAAASISGVAP